MEPDYIPSYFNTFYDIEREYYSSWTQTTKSRYLTSYAGRGDGWTSGYYLDLVFDITGTFSIGGSFEHNKLYNYEAKIYNNYQINIFTNAFLFDSLAIDFTMTFQSLEKPGTLKKWPYYSGAITYYLDKYFSFGFRAASKWHLVNARNYAGSYNYYNCFSIGGFAGVRF